jgi:pimeloyl-ACP methyl ester carboxylesterase
MNRFHSFAIVFGASFLMALGQLDAEPTPREVSKEEAHFLIVGNDRLQYEFSGAGCPLVLIGGGSGMDLNQWDAVATELSKEYLTIAYDPRGSGLSENPSEAYSDIADLTALLDHMGISRALLLGLSSSGGFALEYAVVNPNRLLGVVAAGPFIPQFEFTDNMQQRIQRIGRAAQTGREEFLDAMFDDPHFIPAPLAPEIRGPARANMGQNYDKGANFDPSLAQQLDPPLIVQLGQIPTPVYLLAGELDHPEIHRRNEFLQNRLQHAETETIPQAGHNVHLEAPLDFVASIRPFVADHCAQH